MPGSIQSQDVTGLSGEIPSRHDSVGICFRIRESPLETGAKNRHRRKNGGQKAKSKRPHPDRLFAGGVQTVNDCRAGAAIEWLHQQPRGLRSKFQIAVKAFMRFRNDRTRPPQGLTIPWTLRNVCPSNVSVPRTLQNCLGRSSTDNLPVSRRNRVPSPPARTTAQRSRMRSSRFGAFLLRSSPAAARLFHPMEFAITHFVEDI